MNIEFLPVKHLITRNTGRRRERLKIPHSARENVNEVDTAALFYAVLCPRPVLKITHRQTDRQTDRQTNRKMAPPAKRGCGKYGRTRYFNAGG